MSMVDWELAVSIGGRVAGNGPVVTAEEAQAAVEELKPGVDPTLLGRLQNSAHDRNWDSIEALWQMKNEVRDDPELERHRQAACAESVSV